MKKVAILAAPGFEEIELMAPLDILRRLNMDVVLAGVQSDKVVSTHEVTVSTDTMLDKLHADKLDALILPGGAGSWVLRDTPEVIHLVKKMHEAGKLVAAICAAPIVPTAPAPPCSSATPSGNIWGKTSRWPSSKSRCATRACRMPAGIPPFRNPMRRRNNRERGESPPFHFIRCLFRV